MTLRITALPLRIVALSSTFLVGSFVLSGCSSDPNTPTADVAEASSVSSSSPLHDQYVIMNAFESQKMEYQQKFDTCLGGKMNGDSPDQKISDSQREAAKAACAAEVGEEPQPTPEQVSARRTVFQGLIDCVKGKGHKMPDLDPSGNLPSDEIMNEYSKNDPTLEKDAKACIADLVGVSDTEGNGADSDGAVPEGAVPDGADQRAPDGAVQGGAGSK
ncbi:hypothetical protein [Rathayibacter toxicus]|uniref:Lipoprotein n=1 Tax=Rathayibacter toxicus TaxID=145458 RepID=A0A2S5Y821_9MICO|nr:hypothetical protein [Rathayibacter toxicus]PPH24650.1 hypothetical protein C5D17_01260 [Rathayibacter toxicus]PPH58575.1 hypothetical protein C5D30_01270 [Rathayibacter toxicus]PPH60567.1 hypothetical protein C5C93_01295 [Rathayibacter toxicus]PPH88387.1 hypothetical protein C5D31_01270 [Rathayibacter toxicus]PPI16080.1 hypothetical protein C5C51_01265 [Rathayibacter toxicus]